MGIAAGNILFTESIFLLILFKNLNCTFIIHFVCIPFCVCLDTGFPEINATLKDIFYSIFISMCLFQLDILEARLSKVTTENTDLLSSLKKITEKKSRDTDPHKR